jgi:hypothetical protein
MGGPRRTWRVVSSLSDLSGAGSRGDRFQALYEANYHRVLGYALRRADRDDAADVVAETFLVAWRRLDDVPSGEVARLWLYGTARRVLANQQRGKRRRERLTQRLQAKQEPHVVPDPGSVRPPPRLPSFRTRTASFCRSSLGRARCGRDRPGPRLLPERCAHPYSPRAQTFRARIGDPCGVETELSHRTCIRGI